MVPDAATLCHDAGSHGDETSFGALTLTTCPARTTSAASHDRSYGSAHSETMPVSNEQPRIDLGLRRAMHCQQFGSSHVETRHNRAFDA